MHAVLIAIVLFVISTALPTGLVIGAWVTRGPVQRVRKSPARRAALLAMRLKHAEL